MLVQRAFRDGAAVQNSEKATMIGVLLGRVRIGGVESILSILYSQSSTSNLQPAISGQPECVECQVAGCHCEAVQDGAQGAVPAVFRSDAYGGEIRMQI